MNIVRLKNKAIFFLLSLSFILLNVILYLPLSFGWLNYVFDTPDRTPPFNLSNEVFGEISTSICLIFLFASTFRFIYLTFKGKNFKQLVAPAILSIFVLLTTISLNNIDYITRAESRYPKGAFYYWSQNREYSDKIEFIRWKKPIDSDDGAWELDSVSITKVAQE